MTPLVVDASVGLKWFLPEVHSEAARRLQNPALQLHVPSLFDVEIANILWKKIRRAELTRAEADAVLSQLFRLPLTRHPDSRFLSAAFDLADRTQRTVYDCLYLALAVELAGQLVTADQRLHSSLAGTPWASAILWVEDVP
jgi:predicted nucleic acid-binding protein